jgi:hypothetical protein
MGKIVTTAVALLALSATRASADLIVLRNGTELEGTVVSRADGRVTIRTTAGIATTVNADQVKSIEERPTLRDVYKKMASKLKPDDAEGHYALAIWCRDRGLRSEATAELVETLHANPNHAAARTELGYVKTADGWMSREDAMRAKGMVLVNGRWIDRKEAEERKKQKEQRRILAAITASVYKVHAGSTRTAREHEEKLAAFDDPAFAGTMRRLLEDRDSQVRRAACSSLARMKDAASVPVLAGMAIVDPDDTVRSAALSAARELHKDLTCAALFTAITQLKLRPIRSRSDQKQMHLAYRRIAECLDEVGDIRSVPFLIQILYPKVELEGTQPTTTPSPLGPTITSGVGGPTGINIVRGTIAIGTLGARPFPNEPSKYYYNSEAERVLKKLTGKDFGVLPRDWAKWWNRHGAELIRKFEAERRAEPGGGADLLENIRRGQP